MRNKSLAVITAALVALSLVGGTYSLWHDWLYIDVTANMGTIGLVYTNVQFTKYDDFKEISILDAWADGETLWVTIDIAYPCVTYRIDFDLLGVGSVPVHIYDIDVTDPDMLPYLTWGIDGWPGPVQIHEDDRAHGYLEIHFDNSAVQGATYTFAVTIHYGQYNEQPT